MQRKICQIQISDHFNGKRKLTDVRARERVRRSKCKGDLAGNTPGKPEKPSQFPYKKVNSTCFSGYYFMFKTYA